MNTLNGTTNGTTNLVVIEPKDPKLDDITITLPPAKTIAIKTATYKNYNINVMTQTLDENKANKAETAELRQLITNIIAVKKDDDLIVTAADASKVIFTGFYTAGNTDDACTVTLGGEVGGGGGGVTITPDSPVGQTLIDGSFIVYIYADSHVLADMLTEVDGVTLGLSELPKGAVSYIPTISTEDEETNYQGSDYQGSNDQGTHWWWLAGGVALVAVGVTAGTASDDDNTDNSNVDTSTPVFPNGASATVTLDENTVTSKVVYDAQATDNGGVADANITYTLTGTDASAFNIVATTGVVTLKASADYETKPHYKINVIATDPAGNAAKQALTVNVTDLPDTNTVSGAIVLGPLVADHGLQVELYKADGTSLITTVAVKSDGSFIADIGSYADVIIAKVVDTDDGADYVDEASGKPVDLSDSPSFTLLAVIDTSKGGDVTAAITPLTTLAAQQAGLSASGEVPSNVVLTTTVVNNANQAVANLFGLTGDVVKNKPEAVITQDGTPATTSNDYGKVLAVLSAIDKISGGVEETIKQFKNQISGSGADLILSDEGQQAMVDGQQAVIDDASTPTTGEVTIDGPPAEDQTLTAVTSALADEDGLGTFTYQWQADGVDIVGATSATFILTQAQVGQTITVEVSYTDGQGEDETVTSDPTITVTNVNDPTTGVVTIDGTPAEDQTLTANTSDLADVDGLGTFSYQWQADGVDIVGATSATFILTQAQVGQTITVEVSYTDGQGEDETVTSDPTITVTNVNDPTTGVVTIDGTPAEDQTLTANTSDLADVDGLGTFSYQWQADGVDIVGATSATFILTQAQVGKIITVVVIHTDALGTTEPAITSDPTITVTNVNDPTTGVVTIDGTPAEDQTLTANTSDLADVDGLGTFSYQWQADNVAISGETDNTLTLTQAQVGKTITVVVTHTDAQSTVEPAKTSAATATVTNVNDPTTGVVTITGAAAKGQTLIANTSALADEDGKGTFTYQWQADGVDIVGATSATFILTQAQVGQTITVEVSYTDGQGEDETVTSDPTITVTNVNDPTTGVVTIDGTPAEDQTLTANTSALADEDGLGTFTYQWQADGADISGANNPTLTLTQAQVGKIITVVVIHTDALNIVEPAKTSAPTIAVTNVNDPTTGVVTIDGAATAAEDQTLTANTSALADEDGKGTFTYRWQADDAAISGETDNTLTLTQAQVGKIITVVVIHTDALGTTEPAITSAPTTVVGNVNDLTTGVVTIDGAAAEDQTLTANTSALADEDGLGTFTYQWQADGAAISGETDNTLTLTQDQVGKTITVVVIHTDTLGNPEPAKTSAPTIAVTNVNDPTTGVVTIDGTPAEDQTLTANTSALTDEDGLGAFTYQWQAAGIDITDATSAALTLTQAQVGKIITVVVTHTDAQSTVEPAITSAPTAEVVSINAPTQTATIVMVSDDDNTYGSVVGVLATGTTTDDTTPTLTGTLSAALTDSLVLAIYDNNGDGTTKLGEAVVTDTDWTYTPSSALTAGSHGFTARVEDPINGLGAASAAHVVNINPGINMTVTDDVGDVTGALNPAVRYILLKQTGSSSAYLRVGEVEVFSGGENVALGKTVTAGYGHRDGYLPSGITDGSLVNTRGDGYRSSEYTTDNWLLIDLGANYSRIDRVNVYALSSSDYGINNIRNVDIFASNADLSSLTYEELTNVSNAINLGGTGSSPAYKTSLTTPVITITDDSTPTLSGTLATALGANEELAIYNGTEKLAAVTVNGDNSWSFTTPVLTDGSHTLKAVIQAADENNIANARVISAAYTITVDFSITAPTQTVTITAVSDDVSTHGSAVGALATGASTDDTMPTLTGTLSAALTADQVLVIYDGATKLGEATVTGTDWTYTPNSALTAGSHSFTAQVKSLASNLQGMASAAHVVNINPGINMTVTDDVGDVTGALNPAVRYILLKQTGSSYNGLRVGEVEVFSGSENVALGKTVTAGYDNRGGYLPSGVTDGSLVNTRGDGYRSNERTTDNWLLIDLGAYYSRIDRVNVYALSSSDYGRVGSRISDKKHSIMKVF